MKTSINFATIMCTSGTNVYKFPDRASEVIRVLKNLTEVVIDKKYSTDEFFKVYLTDGKEGFCEKSMVNPIR